MIPNCEESSQHYCKRTIEEHVGPQRNDGVVRIPDEKNGLAVSEGQVRRPEFGRLPSPVPAGDLGAVHCEERPVVPRPLVLPHTQLPVVRLLGDEYAVETVYREYILSRRKPILFLTLPY